MPLNFNVYKNQKHKIIFKFMKKCFYYTQNFQKKSTEIEHHPIESI